MPRIDMDDQQAERLTFGIGRSTQRAHHTWFRGEHCNFNPKLLDLMRSDGVQRYVLAGLVPSEPSIDPQTKIVAFGSCFAANITKWLAKRRFNVLTSKEGAHADTYLVRCGEGMVNSFVIRQQFEWALEGKVFSEELWHGYDAEAFGYDETVRLHTRDVMMAADVFVITLGLSEIWYDEVTGGVFWRAVPQRNYDPSRHKFRVSTVGENRDNLAAIVRLIKGVRPSAKIIFTLSPIPLVATFRDISCIVANSVSKATLRIAIDETVRDRASEGVFYWPSYEIVTNVFTDPWRERRHVEDDVLDYIMILFEAVWCRGTEPRMTIAEAWVRACAAAHMLPPKIPDAIENEDTALLEAFVARENSRNRPGAAIVMDRVKEIAATNSAGPLARWLADRRIQARV